jgi:hypothetical protein
MVLVGILSAIDFPQSFRIHQITADHQAFP